MFMKLIHKDLKHGTLKLKPESAEDLWSLSTIIEPEDCVSGMSERKIKIGGSEEKSRISRRYVFLKICVEKIEYDRTLRVTGVIVEAPEDIPKGDYHTFDIEEGTIITLSKVKVSQYILKKLDDAVNKLSYSILIVAFDREEAMFALLKNQGYEMLLHLNGDVSKKDYAEKTTNFYAEIIKQIKDYDSRYSFNNIIIASPAFWKDYLLEELKDDPLKSKMIMASCSGIDGSTITEILKRPELKKVLERERSSKESRLVDDLLGNIQKGNAAYGLDEVMEKVISGNISDLLITENYIKKMRDEKRYDEIDSLMANVESLNAEVIIINSEDAARKLDGLSGVACLLRWKENYDAEETR